jgi:hypothetical protein
MKKLIFLLIVSFGFLASQAQNGVGSAYKMPLVQGDTVVNTGTSAKVIQITGGYSGAAIQVKLSLLSGTGAGTVGIYGSNDNSNFTQIGANYTITNTATQATMFYVVAPLPNYIKVLVTGSGTESIVQTVYYRIPKYQQ